VEILDHKRVQHKTSQEPTV